LPIDLHFSSHNLGYLHKLLTLDACFVPRSSGNLRELGLFRFLRTYMPLALGLIELSL
jgi:hypothetical protein